MSANGDRSKELCLEQPVQTGKLLSDWICLDVNLHHPPDWALLRDMSRKLLKATSLIRRAGLCQGMSDKPEVIARAMNCQCLEMTNRSRKSDAKKARKPALRKFKPFVRTIASHGRRHRDGFASSLQSTRYGEVCARQIVARIDRMLAHVPVVIAKTHERIIAERQVESIGKILNVHESSIIVIVRGKVGKEVEFGYTLMMAESRQGLILDWKIYAQAVLAGLRHLQCSAECENEYDLSKSIRPIIAKRSFNRRWKHSGAIPQGAGGSR